MITHSGLLIGSRDPLCCRVMIWKTRVCSLILWTIALGATTGAEDFPEIYDSEPPNHVPLSPQDALARFKAPAGFHVTLFAAEPDVQQPIAMTFDSRGRLWVAENYTYAEREVYFDRELRDRILIFEDTDDDGQFDRRKVFWDRGQLLSSVELGFGGVFALCPPNLLFIPDQDGDDVPDGEPQILLTGWNDDGIRHNLANGLKWGPDGWLYGRHGILATSKVGTPDTPPDRRLSINCGIWRYHPVRKTFEVVAHGTTNPWGLDWDDHGEAFFINTVIGHLWHLIPGAHYRRMYGEDLDPRVYELIDQHADHYHWDTREEWSDVRELGVTRTSLERGGGHAHSGLMIYLGNNWPDRYRGGLFTINFHGRRLNQDRLERVGSGYVGRHGPDEFISEDPWFRGIELVHGPDGGVYVADWSDVGECHDDDGVHRTSGRIYKITYGRPGRPALNDLARASDEELARLHLHENDWYVRQSRRLLQERAAAGKDLEVARSALRKSFEEQRDVPRQLRALWALNVTGGAEESGLLEQLRHKDEHLRTWSIRLLTDTLPIGNTSDPLSSSIIDHLRNVALAESSPLVRLALASTLQRLPPGQRAQLAEPLLSRSEDADDHNLPLMLWYGVKPLAEMDPVAAVRLTGICEVPLTRQMLARRLAEDLDERPEPVDQLIRLAMARDSEALRSDIIAGISDALRGWRQAPKPVSWDTFVNSLEQGHDGPLRDRVRDLSALFGDGRALDEIRRVALDPDATGTARRMALRTLIEHRIPDLREICEALFQTRELAGLSAQGLALFDDPDIARMMAGKYWEVDAGHRADVIAALASRPSFARVLLDRVDAEDGGIPRSHVSAFHARQIRGFNDPQLDQMLAKVWGELRDSDVERRLSVALYKSRLTPETLERADPGRGRALFDLACAPCHRLYGSGGEIAPDLTGSGRHNLDYLLEKLVDPNAMVAADYRVSIVTLRDGRVLTGIIGGRTGRTLTLQTITGVDTLSREDVEEIELTSMSLMPEGLLEAMDDEQARDLIAYLMSSQQVPLPGEAMAR
jgi:putative membrane-bound dehydrogenase-like protein